MRRCNLIWWDMELGGASSSSSLADFDISTAQGLLAAQQSLLQTIHKTKQIGASLAKCGHRLRQMKQRRETLQATMAPLLSQAQDSRLLTEYIRRAVRAALEVADALISIRELEAILEGDPANDVERYVMAVSKVEECLIYVEENRPVAVELLEEAVRVSSLSRLTDNYRMSRLNDGIQALTIGGNTDGAVLDLGLQKVESSFERILADNSAPRDLNRRKRGPDSCLPVKDLALMAECLHRNGKGQRCLKMYWDVRNRTLSESMRTIRTQYLNCNSVDAINGLQWSELEEYVLDWLELLEKVVRDLLCWERDLCGQIFQSFGSDVWTECFGRLAASSVMDAVVQFGDAIALSEREPQIVFKLLDMIQGLDSLRDDFERVFEGIGCMEIRLRLRELQKQLVHSSCRLLCDFPVQVAHDTDIPSDGSTLKITGYTVNFLKFLVGEYGAISARVLKMEGLETGLFKIVLDVFEALEQNLEARAKGYAEPALAHLFLMNNYWYIFKRARDSELAFLGEEWLKQHRRAVNQHVLGYEKHAWGPLLVHLSRDGLVVGSAGRAGTAAAKDLFRQRLRAFNADFEEFYATHRHWVISDAELREGTFVKVMQTLVPAYRSYTETFSHWLDNTGTGGSKYLRYTPEQLEDLLSRLFADT